MGVWCVFFVVSRQKSQSIEEGGSLGREARGLGFASGPMRTLNPGRGARFVLFGTLATVCTIRYHTTVAS